MNIPGSRAHLSLAAWTALLYAALVLAMWLPFGPGSGLPYETGFPVVSESTWALEGSLWKGFFYADPLRMHTNTFYHLSYLLAECLGISGSFFPYQLVMAILWWARGFLMFLIVQKFLPGRLVLSFSIGALALVHSSDGAVQWVGQLNQYGYMFWMLAGFHALLVSFEQTSPRKAAGWACAAALCEFMSLWSYESHAVLMLSLPLLLLLLERSRRALLYGACWLVVPSCYMALTVLRYTSQAGDQTYQAGVMRNDWAPSVLLSDWGFNIVASLKFWAWAGTTEWHADPVQVLLPALAAVAIFSGGVALCHRYAQKQSGPADQEDHLSNYWSLLGIGLALVALSFPAYLLLNSARSLWRTQFLAGVGAALVFGGVIGLLMMGVSVRLRVIVAGAVGSAVVAGGSISAIKKGAFHHWIWERHRYAIAQVIQVAPAVRSGTLVVLTNVSRQEDPFGHNMWFEFALRLAYPFTRVGGFYVYSDGTYAPGRNLQLVGDRWKWDRTGMLPMYEETEDTALLGIEYSSASRARLLKPHELPEDLMPPARAAQLYAPQRLIDKGPPSVRAVRRYRPFSVSAPLTGQARIKHAPVSSEVKPKSGKGNKQVFSFVVSDQNGHADIGAIQVLFNATLTPVNACFLHFDQSANAVWLSNDAGGPGTGPLVLGESGTLHNKQCTVHGSESSAKGAGADLVLNLAMSFDGSFAGDRHVYMAASDRSGVAAGWAQRGTWSVSLAPAAKKQRHGLPR